MNGTTSHYYFLSSENCLEDLMKISCVQDMEINKWDANIDVFASKTTASKRALIFKSNNKKMYYLSIRKYI